jgi:LysM repeat protein
MPAKGKVSFFVKVLMILTVHVVVIGGMLLQGCKDTKDTTQSPDATSTTPDTTQPPVNPGMSNSALSNAIPPAIATAPGAGSNQPEPAISQPAPLVAPVAPISAQPAAGPASTESREYVIASGDTLGSVAKRNGISLRTLLEANAGVNPKKLRVGQKIQIPGGSGAAASAPTAAGVSAPDMSGPSESSVYVVKTGDTLGKIARANHTSFKKIMALNGLKTTSIKVGQKLKLPASRASEAPAAPAAVQAAPIQAAPVQAAPMAPAAPASPAPASN